MCLGSELVWIGFGNMVKYKFIKVRLSVFIKGILVFFNM